MCSIAPTIATAIDKLIKLEDDHNADRTTTIAFTSIGDVADSGGKFNNATSLNKFAVIAETI